MSYKKKDNRNVNKGAVGTVVFNMLSANVQHMAKFVINAIEKTISPMFVKQKLNYNENNVPPAQLQKTPLSLKGILAAVPIC